MHNHRPKVLLPLAGRPLLQQVIETVDTVGPQQLLIVHGSEQKARFEPLLPPKTAYPVTWVQQESQGGTGHAVSLALEHVDPRTQYVLILYGDMPLIQPKTLEKMVGPLSPTAISLLTGTPPNIEGLGRIVRNAKGEIEAIVEHKEATPLQRTITEINAGVYGFPIAALQNIIPSLTNHNQQKEYYLTDVIGHALQQQYSIVSVSPEYGWEIQGINTFSQLAELERQYQQHLAEHWMAKGVHIVDPKRFDIRGNPARVQIAPDVTIDINVILEGNINIAIDAYIGPNAILKNTTLHHNATVLANSHIDGAVIGEHARIGPFARLRPQTVLAPHAAVGNFVEIKQTQLGAHSKVNHLSYVGDAAVGTNVNVGAGTITCNYDGAKKHPTVVGNNASIGAGVQLIAPITVGDDATIGAGTVVTKDVPAATLLYNQLEPCLRTDWQRPKKEDGEK